MNEPRTTATEAEALVPHRHKCQDCGKWLMDDRLTADPDASEKGALREALEFIRGYADTADEPSGELIVEWCNQALADTESPT